MKVGQPIRMVFFTDLGSVAVRGTVRSILPLSIIVSGAEAGLVGEGNRVLLIMNFKQEFFKAEANVARGSHEAQDWVFELANEHWEEVDRRRYPRYPVEVPVQLRAIQELGGMTDIRTFEGKADDLSVGGAWVSVDGEVASGTLVEFQATLSPTERIRMMGLVAHVDDDGFGVEFIDFVGSSRYVLHSYLTQKAA